MPKRLTEATAGDFSEVQTAIQQDFWATNAQQAAQNFVNLLYQHFGESLVLLRLFCTLPYAELTEEDQHFVDRRGRETKTAHLIHNATPVFTLLGTGGVRPEWNDRCNSSHFRCIPLVSSAFLGSLSMLSRQFESVGFNLELIDLWQMDSAAIGQAEHYRGLLHIRDAASDIDAQGHMIVPRQDFVAANGIRTTFGVGTGYAGHPTLLTLFVFTNEVMDRKGGEPLIPLLEAYKSQTEHLIRQGRVFSAK